MLVKMILDSEGQRGGSLFSGKIYSLNETFANELINNGRAKPFKRKIVRM